MDPIRTFPKFTFVFVLLMALELAGLTVIPSFHIVSKPMVLASLIGFYILVEKRQNHAFLSGLIFALLGDCFLLYETVEFFIIGLICFLIMQLCYASAFNQKRKIPRNKDYLVCMLIAVVGFSVLSFLWSDLGSIRTAVSLYTLAIVIMSIYAYLRHPKLRGYNTLLWGVILFVISDALLGADKFSGAIPYGSIFIMVTYMLAQYLIVTSQVLSNIPKPKASSSSSSSSSSLVDRDSSFVRHRRKK